MVVPNHFSQKHDVREFDVAIHYVVKCNSGNQYIHSGDWVINMKLDKDLMHVPIWKTTHWEIDIIDRIIIMSDHPWDPSYINDSLRGSVILLNNNDIDDDFNI